MNQSFVLILLLLSCRHAVSFLPCRRVRSTVPLQDSAKTAEDSSSSMSNYQELDNIDRIFVISDLHTDHTFNQDWLRERMDRGDLGERDLLVVAGDISHDIEILKESLLYMKKKTNVFFVVGNHEAWLRKDDDFDSLDKIQQIYDTCREHGVLVDSCHIKGDYPLWIVPIQSWYDGSLSFSEELCSGFEYWPWVDFLRCRWPEDYTAPDNRIPNGLVEHFLASNQANLDLLVDQKACNENVMTVSHFLPNVQSLPDWKDLNETTFQLEWLDHGAGEMSAKFAKVAGSALIDEQIRTIAALTHIHVFGHSHRPKDFTWGDPAIRYIHNPLGKPREREMFMVSPQVDFQLVWDTQQGQVESEPILRYWDEKGGGKEALWERLEHIRPGRYGARSRPS
jgi:predicted phosphodiesterase